jgi:hypothetical protein
MADITWPVAGSDSNWVISRGVRALFASERCTSQMVDVLLVLGNTLFLDCSKQSFVMSSQTG